MTKNIPAALHVHQPIYLTQTSVMMCAPVGLRDSSNQEPGKAQFGYIGMIRPNEEHNSYFMSPKALPLQGHAKFSVPGRSSSLPVC